ncbi:acyltransferase family protein [Pseudonocardia endophytica]|uniref:Peptidoglycan/LPS O-acetylase OafA/YrhL n=1 Tax=Pseudonocardia endophytica TaxID=401976 RepID=A0A4R1HZ02_PSEEN|nr:acyltransferase family protein [Pseudonocardia endophytica]TCK26415.1 peptidoglycan/LPS O-acetylase OafA/YrhL [Pseudonocardia endophytica]
MGPQDPVAGSVGTTAGHATARRRFRPELEGLRAVAVVLVVVYHVWLNRVSGGVDVFFLISGFLVTGGLYRRAAGKGSVAVRATWARQFARLLPAVAVVLLATVVAAALLLPETRWLPTVREIVASALFLQNWELAADAVDYAARNDAASVVQHFWSLSVQGQFYLVWPLLVGAVAVVARRDGAGLHRALTATLLAVGVPSLVYSVLLTASDQPLAYFHSLTRVWEFALGGLLALWIDRLERLPGPRTRVVIGWTGVAALVSCGLLLTVDRAFPGIAALWPTGAAALVLLAGHTGHRFGADRWLSGPLAQRLGALAFPLYLWHWPILVLTLVVTGREQLGLASGAAVIAASLVLAEATRRLVEEPLRGAGTRTALRTSVALVAVVLVLCGAWQALAVARTASGGEDVAAGSEDVSLTHPGAATLDPASAVDSATTAEAPLLPSLVGAGDDWSYRNGTWQCGPSPSRPDLEVCRIPPPSGAPPQKRIAVVGDSHAQQYTATLMPLAAQRDWELVVMFRGACPYSAASEVDPADDGCVNWNREAADEVAEQRPDALITLASRDVRTGPDGPTEQTPPGFVAQWWRAHDAGIPVVAVRDNPRPGFNVPDCVSREGRHSGACDLPRDGYYHSLPPWSTVPDVPPNVSFLDVADLVCDPQHCPSEVGNVLVYLDDNHLTATYAATLAPAMGRHLETTLAW